MFKTDRWLKSSRENEGKHNGLIRAAKDQRLLSLYQLRYYQEKKKSN